jgi:hypothetical protein
MELPDQALKSSGAAFGLGVLLSVLILTGSFYSLVSLINKNLASHQEASLIRPASAHYVAEPLVYSYQH